MRGFFLLGITVFGQQVANAQLVPSSEGNSIIMPEGNLTDFEENSTIPESNSTESLESQANSTGSDSGSAFDPSRQHVTTNSTSHSENSTSSNSTSTASSSEGTSSTATARRLLARLFSSRRLLSDVTEASVENSTIVDSTNQPGPTVTENSTIVNSTNLAVQTPSTTENSTTVNSTNQPLQIPYNSNGPMTQNSTTTNLTNQPVQTPSQSTANQMFANSTNQSVQTSDNSPVASFATWVLSLVSYVENLFGASGQPDATGAGNLTDEEDGGNGTARRLLVDSNSTVADSFNEGMNSSRPAAASKNATGTKQPPNANCTNSQSCGGDHDSFQGTGINADKNAGSNASPSPSSTTNVRRPGSSAGAILYASPLAAIMWLLV